MAIDFELAPELQALQARIRAFIADEIVPLESDRRRTRHGPTEEFRRELIERARVAGLLARDELGRLRRRRGEEQVHARVVADEDLLDEVDVDRRRGHHVDDAPPVDPPDP
jgi:alkylation response protein AidB-like acyl-CoA dehydrogenase